MPSPERQQFPPWTEQERAGDLAWIAENMHLFWPAAQAAYKQLGRWALVVDTTVRVVHQKGESNPFWYLPQKLVEETGDEEAMRMVAQYDPLTELVTVLLKSEERVSTYRIQVMKQAPRGE
jgi:hypothetical protein